MKKIFALVIVLSVIVSLGFTNNPPDRKYTGNKLCKACHKQAYSVWEKEPHSKAFEVLKSKEAKKIADKMGIKDASKSDKCLVCHVTNGGKGKKVKLEEGVSCEACHGPGSDYKSKKVMEDRKLAIKNGLILGKDDAELCKTCHNKKSPTYKPFDYKKEWKRIVHKEKS